MYKEKKTLKQVEQECIAEGRHTYVRMACLSLLLLLSLGLVGCSDTDDAERNASPGTVHPTAENIPSQNEIVQLISRIQTESPDGYGLAEVSLALKEANEVYSIGSQDGSRYEIIGEIQDVAAGANGSFYVLDSRYNEVRKYDASGQFVEAFGRPGRGPMEFQYPQALEIDPDGRLYVADRNRQIKVFERQDTSYAIVNTISLDFTPFDVCVTEEQIFAQGYKPGEENYIIHEYTKDGEYVKSFGTPYQSDNEVVRNLLSQGTLACHASEDTILLAFQHLPVLFAFSLEGKLKWRSVIKDFNPTKITEIVTDQGQRGLRYEDPEDYADVVLTLEPYARWLLRCRNSKCRDY